MEKKQLIKIIMLFLLITLPSFLVAQSGNQINGRVVDEENEPLPGVSVSVKGTSTGTITDLDGLYAITVKSEDVLVFSFIGFTTQEIIVGQQKSINVTMEEESKVLDDVVVVGYGTQKKVNLTGSVQSVSGNELIKKNVPNTSVALTGVVPGLSAVQGSGQPGADGASIIIRGVGSINSSTGPLILIDGVEGNMNNVDMNMIESISVLKDAASASIYGSRASNGVILVTTKRSKEEKVRITYNGYVGLNKPTELPEAVDAIGYMEAINTARINSGQSLQYPEELIQQYKTEGADNYYRYDTDWKKEVLKKTALIQNHAVSLSGGSKQIKYMANAAYLFQEGQIPNNDYTRLALRANTDAQITDWLKLGLDINIRESTTKRPSILNAATIVNSAITYVPLFSGVNNDGTWGFGQSGSNPIAISKAGGLNKEVDPEVGLRSFLQINPLEGLEMMMSYSTQRKETRTSSFRKQYDTYESGVYMSAFPTAGSQKNESWFQAIQKQFNLQVSYEKTIENHYLKGLAGIQTEELLNKAFGASRMGYSFSGFEELNHGDVSTATNSGSSSEWAMLSYFGRINYAFADRYLLELNGRRDGSSRFVRDQRWGFFPSVSAAWRVSEESFLKPLRKTISNLKIRGSYGTLGNQDISGYYPFASSLYSGYGYWFDGVLGAGIAQTEMANKLITWEKSTQFNVGLDVGLFNSRFDMAFDYYIRNIDDMLQQLPVPDFVGLISAWQNAGSMRNKGWDLSITWRDKIGNLSYSVSGNLSDVKNKVTNLYGESYITETSTTREGYPRRSWFGYVSDGYFQSQEEIDASPVYGGDKNNVKPGYIRYKDISGPDGIPDGKIDDNDRTVIGDYYPHYLYGLNLDAEWKGFDVSLFFQGVGKKDILLTGFGARPFYVGRTIFKHQLDTWTPENRDAEYPLLLMEGSAGSNPNNIVSDFWIKSGAYVRLKNVVLGYTVPSRVMNKLKVERLRLYVSAHNLFTVSNAYKGYDPENSVSSGDFYPVMQTLTFGLNIQF